MGLAILLGSYIWQWRVVALLSLFDLKSNCKIFLRLNESFKRLRRSLIKYATPPLHKPERITVDLHDLGSPTAVAACYIGWSNSVNLGQFLLVYGTRVLESRWIMILFLTIPDLLTGESHSCTDQTQTTMSTRPLASPYQDIHQLLRI